MAPKKMCNGFGLEFAKIKIGSKWRTILSERYYEMFERSGLWPIRFMCGKMRVGLRDGA